MVQTILLLFAGLLVLILFAFWLIGERGHFLRPSSWSLLRQGGWRRFLNLSDLHAYVYGRWTTRYIDVLIHYIFPRLSPEGRRRWTDSYHGKVLTLDQAASIITVDKDIPLQDLEQIIPYPTARELVLKGPPDVASFECGCRHTRGNPCQPTQVCLVVGQPWVDFVLEHRPNESRRLSQTEALEILRAEHERGHLHSAWFKDALLNRFYGICNCCKCCCAGIEAMTRFSAPMMTSSGYVARVDQDICNGCDICAEACAFGAISCNGIAVISWEKCMGCGVCESQCSLDAVTLVRDERKGRPLDVRLIAHA